MVRVVLDNLSTHRMASLYEIFPPAEARRIVKRLEFHHMFNYKYRSADPAVSPRV